MDDELVLKFNNDKFTKRSATFKMKYYNPKSLIGQHLPVKEREKKFEINPMRSGYFIDHLIFADNQEIVKIGGKVVEIYEGVIYRDNFKITPFRRVIDNLFALRQHYKDENNEVMQILENLLLNSLYGRIYEKILKKDSLVNQNIG